MSTIQIRVDDELKKDAYQAFEKLNLSPSDALRLFLRYVAENEKLPFAEVSVMVSEDDEDADILAVVRERLKNPARRIREWNKLEKTIREQFKKKLKKLQQNPYVESARLHGDLAGCFKIKLRASGFRLIYKVIDDEIVIWVVAVGKREDEKAYETARKRLL
ncbi:unnamed protein product [Callosobruchus maculatus]|uniref:Uncharacterized protein n=1 Tax=Callosobruchus maculatus TaxID=64391 RepID=A0A653CSN4_CALMS|nr:unnamed protein product [Callosobruchus maculatus]